LLPLIGAVILSGLNKLDRAKLLTPDSRFKNIALICSLFLEFAKRESGIPVSELLDDETLDGVPAKIIAYCDHYNIELSDKVGVVGTEDTVARFRDEDVSYKGGAKAGFKRASEDRWGFVAAYNGYHEHYHRRLFNYTPFRRKGKRIGGIEFDITKMTRRERKDAAFDGEDPLDEMGMPPED
jgi:hypothetical protein